MSAPAADASRANPFPDSLCHRCGAPPRYVTSDRGSTFIQCPRLGGYPAQPVKACAEFTPRAEGEGGVASGTG